MSDTTKLKEGDTVMLKSGGPVMTIAWEKQDDAWHCQWFENSELKTGAFMASSLMSANKGDDKTQFGN